MSTRPGSDVVLPYKLARQGGRWQGRLALDGFERMQALVSGTPDAAVAVSLAFHRDEEGRCRVRGRAEVDVRVACGRCLLPQACTVLVDIDLCVVGTEAEASAVAADLEPYVLEGEEVRITDLVEDDLLLGLPHEVCPDRDHCPNRPPFDYGDPKRDTGSQRNNPFASLAELVGKRR